MWEYVLAHDENWELSDQLKVIYIPWKIMEL